MVVFYDQDFSREEFNTTVCAVNNQLPAVMQLRQEQLQNGVRDGRSNYWLIAIYQLLGSTTWVTLARRNYGKLRNLSASFPGRIKQTLETRR